MRTMRALRRTNYLIDIGVAVVGTAALVLLRVPLAQLFGVSQEASLVFYHGVVLFSLMFVFYAISHATTSYFYAVEGSRTAAVLVVGEAVLMVVYALVLPQFIGLDGVWLTVVACQATLAVASLFLLRRNTLDIARRTHRQRSNAPAANGRCAARNLRRVGVGTLQLASASSKVSQSASPRGSPVCVGFAYFDEVFTAAFLFPCYLL